MTDKDRQISVGELAGMVEGKLAGDGSVVISGVASLEHAGPDCISFLGNPKFKEVAEKSAAGALIVSEVLEVACPQIVVSDPYSAFVKMMGHFYPEDSPEPGVHPSAVVDDDAKLGEGVSVGPLAVIGRGCKVGAKTRIGAGAVIGSGCEIGEDSAIHARVSLYPGTRVGSRVIIHSGTVIGSDGFGFILSPQGHVKKPQVGTVVIEDDVEIGANCTIDRAMLDATVVGAGTKLDNMVHLAHNVRTGRNCIILAGTTVGGSTRLGDFCIISGNVTVKDNITIGDGVMVAGHSGVSDDVPAGQKLIGYPAMPFSLALRVFARIKQLPDLFKRVRELEKAAGRKPGPQD